MGDSPRPDKPGKPLRWEWVSLSLRAIAPRDDRGELSGSETFIFNILGFQ